MTSLDAAAAGGRGLGSGAGPAYSRAWRETFGRVDAASTEAEVDFLARMLPAPRFVSVLDVACGPGRHLLGLTARGYRAVGVDVDRAVVAEARAAGLDARVGDMHDVSTLGGGFDFDAVICMWASFGYFDSATNAAVLDGFATRLRPGGRLVLDVYHRGFFEARQGERVNRGVRERKTVRGGRLYVELAYPDGERDRLSWQLFAPAELEAAAARVGLSALLRCSGFDERLPPTAEAPRMQLVFERPGPRGNA